MEGLIFGILRYLKNNEQGEVSKLIFENDAIRNRISNDFDKRWFLNQKRN